MPGTEASGLSKNLKSKITNYKIQITNKFQITMSKITKKINSFNGWSREVKVFISNCSFSIANLALKSEAFQIEMLNAKFNMLNDPAPLAAGGTV